MIVRLYESLGGRASATVSADFAVASISATDLLERPDDSASLIGTHGGTATVSLRPFQICTLRFHR